MTTSMISTMSVTHKYLRHLDSLRVTAGGDGDLDTLMNGFIKKKLKIIPKDVT